MLIIIRTRLLTEIRWYVCKYKSHRSLCVLFYWTNAGLCIFHLFVWWNLNFLNISQWITIPPHSCLVLYSFCANLLHSLIMRLLVESLSPHNLHCQFVASYLFLEFFTSVLADGLSLEFELQQVSSSLQDSSQDSGRS